MHILLLGARGYVGSTLLKILLRHAHIEKITLASDTAAGLSVQSLEAGLPSTSLKKIDQEQCYVSTKELLSKNIKNSYDALFSALPSGLMSLHIEQMYDIPSGIKKNSLQKNPAPQKEMPNKGLASQLLVDLSSDFRLKKKELYLQYYDREHESPSLLHNAIYGLSEWYRNNIKDSRKAPTPPIIANPGCYPTSALLPLLPVLRNCEVDGLIHIHSISSISGAGKNIHQDTLFCEKNENISAYKPGLQHRHVPEIQQCLEELSSNSEIAFMFSPHLAPLSQGMFTTIAVPLISKAESQRALDALQAQYLDEQFVHVHDTSNFGTADVRDSNMSIIYAHCEDNCIILHCAIDNLWKGAAGQAVQNFNIYFDFEENEGLS